MQYIDNILYFKTILIIGNATNRNVVSASCQCPAGLGEKCKHIFALTHYINIEDGHSKTSQHCEWSAPKISKAGKDCKGKRIEELFPPKNPSASFIVTNNIPDFQVPSLFSLMYNEEKKN